MVKIYKLCLAIALLIGYGHDSHSQNSNGFDHSVRLGKCETLLKTFKQELSSSSQRKTDPQLELQLPNAQKLIGKINFQQSADQNETFFVGEINGVPSSTFSIRITATNIEGSIILKNSKKAFVYYADESQNAFIKEADINSVICIDYDRVPSQSTSNQRTSGVNATMAVNLQSLPGANGCVLLDFDGQVVSGTRWNGGNTINAQPAGLSDAQMQETWEVVSEDFRPFNVNITTNEAVFNTYPKNRRMRCIITPTSTAAPGAGGVAYINSFSWNDDTPCWVFVLSGKGSGEAASHEIGHTFGLGHDGRTSPSEGYFQGHGSWAPIMGVGYYRSITQWSIGEYANANNKEDDLAKITSTTHGVGYRTDDHGNSTTSATAIKTDGLGNVSADLNFGIIERTADVDFFSFKTSGGSVSLNFNPVSRHANLDVLAKLYNSSGTLVSTHNPAGLPSSLSTTLAAGTYYISIDGTGAGNPSSDGYSDYSSLGRYTISGKIPATTGNQAPKVAITSPASGASFTSPASIAISATASDADGTVTKVEFYNGATKLGEDLTSPYSFTWTNVAVGSYTITARAIDNGGLQSNTSINVVVSTSSGNQLPVVSIKSPVNNSGYTSPAAISILAEASDPDGSIVRVEFFNGSTRIGTKTAAPYSMIWSSVGPGTYRLTAKATDNAGAVVTSSAVTVIVNTLENVVATVYQACNYNVAGYAVGLAPGRYTTAQLVAKGIRDNDISSLKVKSGYEIILFNGDNFSNGGWIFRFDYACLTNPAVNFNDKTSSIIVQTSTVAQAEALSSEGYIPTRIERTLVTPNPVCDKVEITFNNFCSDDAKIEVFDSFNRKLKVVEKFKSGGSLDLTDLVQGIYIVRIKTGKAETVQRIVKR